MTELPTVSELATRAQDAIREARDAAGLGTVNLRAGSRLSALVSVCTALFNRVARIAADRSAASLPSSSRGDDLDILARDVYGTRRKDPAAARGFVWLHRPSGGAGIIPRGTRVAVPPADGQRGVVFEASEQVSFLSGVLIVRVPIVCTEAGSVGNVQDRTLITQIVDTIPTTSPASTWTIGAHDGSATADEQLIGGGAERESDDVLAARLNVLSADDARETATEDAVLGCIINRPGVRYVNVVEPLDGTIAAYVGDENFALTTAMIADIQDALRKKRGLGVPVRLRSFTVSDVTITATVYMARALVNYDLAAVKQRIVEEVLAYFAQRSALDEYAIDAIDACFHKAHPEVQTVARSLPAASVYRHAQSYYASALTRTVYRATEARISLNFQNPTTS